MAETLVVLYGGLSAQSFIKEQLEISSVFDLFVKRAWFLSDLENDFPVLQAKVQFLKKSEPMPQSKEEALKILDLHLKTHQAVLLWPAHQWPQDIFLWQQKMSDAMKNPFCCFRVGQDFCYYKKAEAQLIELMGLPAIDLQAGQKKLEILYLSPPPRFYNKIEMTSRGIRKTCNNSKKGEAEVFFYENVPDVLKSYFPQIMNHGSSADGYFYEIEKIQLFDMSRFLIHQSMSSSDWKTFFSEIKKYLSLSPFKKVGKEKVQASLHELLVKKLEQRLEEFIFHNPHQKKSIQWSSHLVAALEKNISQITAENLYFSHGDLCFSNILYNKQTQELKLIDPRGSLDISGLYLPLFYDIAKLSHSVYGGYDRIMAQLEKPQEPPLSLEKEFALFVEHLKMDMSFIRLIEASLFLSMLPLHSDNPHLWENQIRAAQQAFQWYQSYSNVG